MSAGWTGGHHTRGLTLSIMAKIRSTLFSGVFSSSGSSTVLPCRGQARWGRLLALCPLGPWPPTMPPRPELVPGEDCVSLPLPAVPPSALCSGPAPSAAPALPPRGTEQPQAVTLTCQLPPQAGGRPRGDAASGPGPIAEFDALLLPPPPHPQGPGLSPPSGKWHPQCPASRSW